MKAFKNRGDVMDIRAILVDDEPLALELLAGQLSKVNGINIVGTYNSFDVAKQAEILEQVNVVFIDIEMPEINGLNLAEMMLEVNPKLLVVFVTAYNEYAVQAFA